MRCTYYLWMLLSHVVFSTPKEKLWKDMKTFEIPSVKLGLLENISPSTFEHLMDVLSSVGAIAISEIPGYSLARYSALKNLPYCIISDPSSTRLVMNDESSRFTIDAETVKGVRNIMISPCNNFVEDLREIVESVTIELFKALDSYNAEQIMSPYRTFSDIIRHGDHLEHFHSYYGSQSVEDIQMNIATIDFHTDMGILITMTTGLYSGEPPSPYSGLYLKLQNGETVRAQSSDDSIIIMMGEGGAHWLVTQTGKPFRAVPHALYANLQGSSASRSWYGKMILPPPNAVIPNEGMTYDSYRRLQHDVVRGKHLHPYQLPVGCGGNTNNNNNTRKLVSSNACTVTENGDTGILCWMQCVSVTTLPCASDAVCYDSVSQQVVDGTAMCPSHTGCSPMCPKSPPDNSSYLSHGYCSGTGSVMYMDGFKSIGLLPKDRTECLNFLFLNWTLNSQVKFAFACIGTFLGGVLVQLLIALRAPRFRWKQNKTMSKCIVIGLYAVQVTLGYFLMLIVMTYSVELFSMACLGLVVGFRLFNLADAPAEDTNLPCCADVHSEIVHVIPALLKDDGNA